MIPKRSGQLESIFTNTGCNNCGKCAVCTTGLTTPPACPTPDACPEEEQ